MIGPICRVAAQAALKSPWLKSLAMTVGMAAATTLGSKAADLLFDNRRKSSKLKITALEELMNEGQLSGDEFKELKRKVLESFASA